MIEFKKNNFLFNAEVNTCLTNIIKNKSFANGYIFYGAEGIGKKQTAFQFIKEIFKQSCPNGNVEERIDNRNYPDLLIVESSSFLKENKSQSYDLVRTIKNESEIIKIFLVKNQLTQGWK